MKSIDGNNAFKLYADCPTCVGEGPLWDKRNGVLIWIDVFNGDVYRMPKGGSPKDFERYQLGVGKIGGLVFAKDGGLLVFANEGKVWHWNFGDAKPELKAWLKEAAPSRFNDVIADPEGRVYCGVAPVVSGGEGSFWRMDADFSFACVEPVTKGMPNGLGFTPDLKKLYFTVTNERTIYRYDYCRKTGVLSNRSVFVEVPESEGLPDGMTVDAEGCVWSAQWNGRRLVRYSPQGEKLLEYTFDIEKISCAIFGGDDYSKLFISTANHPHSPEEYARSKAGAIFVLEKAGKGAPEFLV